MKTFHSFKQSQARRGSRVVVRQCTLGALILAVAGMIPAAQADHHDENGSQQQGQAARTIDIIARGYSFIPSRIVAEPGQRIQVNLHNKSRNQHSIVFELPRGEVELDRTLRPGLTGTMNLLLPQSTGEYVFYCPVANHRELGMEGRLVITERAGEQLGAANQQYGTEYGNSQFRTESRSQTQYDYEPGTTRQRPQQSQLRQRYGRQIAGLRTVRGEVIGVRPITFLSGDQSSIAKVRLEEGRTVFIDLGPEQNLADFDIQPGDILVARGRLSSLDGRTVLQATEIRVNGDITRIQREQQQFGAAQRSGFDREYRGGIQRFGERGVSARFVQPRDLRSVISDWPNASQQAARDMIQKYGQPDGVTESMLVWHDNGPWKRTIVYRDPIPHQFPMQHVDVLEQTINMSVPTDKFDELAEFDGSIIVDRTKGEASARCDKEAMNILALNLAHDIVHGERNVEEARRFYARTAQNFKQGERPSYTQQLQFEVAENTADPGEPLRLDQQQ